MCAVAQAACVLILMATVTGCGLLGGKDKKVPWDDLVAGINAIKSSTVSADPDTKLSEQVSRLEGSVASIGTVIGIVDSDTEDGDTRPADEKKDSAPKASASPGLATPGLATASELQKVIDWLPGENGVRPENEETRLATEDHKPEWEEKLFQSVVNNLLLLPLMIVVLFLLVMAAHKIQKLSLTIDTSEKHLQAMRESMGMPSRK